MPDCILTDDEIAEVKRRVGGTRIRSLLEAQVAKVLRLERQKAAAARAARRKKA